MNRIINIHEESDDDDDDDDDDVEENDFAFWNDDSQNTWNRYEDDEVDEYRVQMKLEEIESAHTSMSALGKKMKRLVLDLKTMRHSQQSWPRAVGREIRPLLRLTKQLVTLQQQWDQELALVNECVALRRNDKHVTKVDNRKGESSLLPLNYGCVIGSCLRYNTRVTDFTIHLPWIQRDPNTYLQYIRSSRSLQRVAIIAPIKTNLYDVLARRFLCAMCKNPRITELQYWHVYIPPKEFAALLLSKQPQASSITVLNIEISNWKSNYTAQEQELLVRSITSRNLNRLQLSINNNNDDWNTVTVILQHLTHHPTHLTELSLQTWCGDTTVSMQAVAEFVQSTETLQHLELDGFGLDGQCMRCVVNALKVHYLKPTASIIKLSFTDCKFDNDASFMFMQYMQTPVVPDPDNNQSRSRAFLQELAMKFGPEQELFTAMFGGKPLGEAMVSLISRVTYHNCSDYVISENSAIPRHPTIGSQLERLSLYPITAMSRFWATLEANAKLINIPRLHLSVLQPWDCTFLGEDLDKLRSLRELHLSTVLAEGVQLETLVRTLRENDSIHSITVEDCKNQSLLKPSDARKLKACCDRNKYLHELGKDRTRWRWNKNVVPHVHRNKRPKLVEPSDHHYDKALLIPLLLQAGKQVREKIRLNNVVSALLTFEVGTV